MLENVCNIKNIRTVNICKTEKTYIGTWITHAYRYSREIKAVKIGMFETAKLSIAEREALDKHAINDKHNSRSTPPAIFSPQQPFASRLLQSS